MQRKTGKMLIKMAHGKHREFGNMENTGTLEIVKKKKKFFPHIISSVSVVICTISEIIVILYFLIVIHLHGMSGSN